jgi:spermidine/putrescine transport system ATP-binding protein
MSGGEIRLVGLVKRFDDVTAVDGIDLDVPGGEFFALLGPSGCGKTTTLRLVAGFEQPTDGRILLDGVDMARTPPHKRKVNTVFQSYALFPFLNAADNVAFGLRFQDVGKAEARRRVAEALALSSCRGWSGGGRPSCPAASSSGSRWPGRWSSTRRCCCWTSPWAPSTPSCARPSRSS